MFKLRGKKTLIEVTFVTPEGNISQVQTLLNFTGRSTVEINNFFKEKLKHNYNATFLAFRRL